MQTHIRVKNLRECRFFFMYIKDKVLKSASIVFDINNPDIALSERIINNTLERFYPDAPDRALFIREMELILSTTVLPEKYFSWLNDDKRAAYWFWGNLCNYPDFNDSINKKINSTNYTKWYELAKLTLVPTDHSERYNAIITVIDTICIYTNKSPLIREWLNDKKLFWGEAIPLLSKFKWLTPDDEDSSRWIIKLLGGYQKSYCEGNRSVTPVKIPSPLSAEECYYTVYALIDLWKIPTDYQDKIITRINKAFYQKTFRKNLSIQKNRKDISEEHQKRLDTLVKFYRSDRMSVIEMLIDDRLRGVETRISKYK